MSTDIIPVGRKATRGGGGGGEGGGRYNLPEELLAEILWRLPLKSLFQLKTVCKSWRDFISSPDFLGLFVKIIPPSDLLKHTTKEDASNMITSLILDNNVSIHYIFMWRDLLQAMQLLPF